MGGLFALTRQTGTRLAEVGFLLILFAGVWLVVAEILRLRRSGTKGLVAGVALAAGGWLLIFATHWGHFG